MKNKKEKKAFTLAETLITLLIIGVVAVLTIPTLTTQINEYILQKQKDVFSKKWVDGLSQMRVDGKLESSYTTAEFVNEMQNYFKIANVCDSSNLANCFAEKITSYENGEAEEFEVKDLKSAKNFNKTEEDAPVYGIRFADGTSMLLAYKKGCTGISEGDTKGNHTQCLLYVYDVNANKSPNTYGGNTGTDSNKSDGEISTMNKGRDLVGNASITKGNAYGLDFEIIGNTSYAKEACTGPNNDICFTSVGGDYWLGAQNFCENMGGTLPDKAHLERIAEKLYNCEKSGNQDYFSCAPDTSLPLWNAIGTELNVLGNPVISLWANSLGRNTNYAETRSFSSSSSFVDSQKRTTQSQFVKIICVK